MCYTAKQYDNRVKKLMELEAMKKELEEKIAAVRDDITKDMGDAEQIETGLFKIHFTKVEGNRFDTKRFRAEQGALYAAYQIPTASRRFSYAAI